MIGLFRVERLPEWIAAGIHILFVTLSGLLLNQVVQYAKLIPKAGLIPAVVWVTLQSWITEMPLLSPALLLAPLVLYLLFRILRIYNQQHADSILFDIGIVSAFMSLFYFPMIVFGFFSIFAVFRLRSTSGREFFILLSGFFVVCFIIGTAAFWYDRLPDFLHEMYFPSSLPRLAVFAADLMAVKMFLIGILILISLWFLNQRFSSHLVQVRKYFGTFINLLVFSMISFFFDPPALPGLLFLILLPGSVFITYYIRQSKNTLVSEFIFLGLVGAALIFQYINFAEVNSGL